MKYKIPLYFLIVLPLLLSFFAVPFAIPPTEVAVATPADRPKSPVKILSVNYPTLWSQFWEDYASWSMTPNNEDLNVIFEYPAEDTCKVSLDITASKKATYIIKFKIDMKFIKWEEIDSTSILLEYGKYKIIFDFSDVENMKLTHSQSTTGRQFVFQISRAFDKNEHLLIDPQFIIDDITFGLGFQNHIWLDDDWTYIFPSWFNDLEGHAGSGFWWNASDDGYVTSTRNTIPNSFEAAGAPDGMDMTDVYFNGTHFFSIHVLQNEEKIYYVLNKLNSSHLLEELGKDVVYDGSGTDGPPAVSADSAGYAFAFRDDQEVGARKPAIQVHNNTDRTNTWTPGNVHWLRGWDPPQNTGYGQFISLSGRDMYVLFTLNETNSLLYGKHFDYSANTWDAEENVSDIMQVISGSYFDSTVVNGVLYVVYRDTVNNRAYIRSSVVDSGSWSAATDLSGESIYGSPQITRHETSNMFWVTWVDTTDGIWTRKWDGAWTSAYLTKQLDQNIVWIDMPPIVSDLNQRTCGFLFSGSDLYYDEIDLGPVSFFFQINDMEGCGDWIFANERYYEFNATVHHEDGWASIDTFKVRFHDGEEYVTVAFDVSELELTLENGEDKVNVRRGDVYTNVSATDFRLHFDVFFESDILDALDIDVEMWALDTDSEEYGWAIVKSDYFNIYNLGGQFSVLSSGDAGRLTGGDVMELYAYNASWAQANTTFRKLQAEHFYVRVRGNKVQWDTEEGDPWNVTFGMYVCPEGEEFIEGWRVVLSLVDGLTWIGADPGPGTDAYYITWFAKWYNRDSATADWDLIKTDTFTSLPVWNGTDNLYTSLWVDLWFNEMNASTIFGGRVNSEYFGIQDSSDWFAFWATDWGATIGNVTQSMYFDNLENTAGEIISARQLKMMKPFFRVEQGVNAARNNTLEIKDYDVLDFREAEGIMEGVPTPIFVASKMPDMPSTGFLAGLVGAFSQIGNSIVAAISWGALSIWTTLVQFLDTIGSYLGYPNAFTNFTAYLTEFFSYLTDAMANLGTMMTEVFTFFLDPVVKMLTYIGLFFSNLLTTLTTMVNIVTGVYGWSTDLFDYFNLADFITLFFVFTVPIMMLQVFKREGIGGIWRMTSTFLDILSFFISLFIRIANFIIGILVAIVEAIPVIE